MARLIILCLLVLLGSLGAAIYVQVDSGRLRLPISGAATGLLIALPLCAAANAVVLWMRATAPPASPKRHHKMRATLPAALQAAQGLLTTALATLFLAALVGWPGGDTVHCALDATWQRSWSARDDQTIRAVQDAFNCRGFKTGCDRGWPRIGEHETCPKPIKDMTPCAPLWRGAARHDLAMALAVAVTIGILQAALLIYRSILTLDGGELFDWVFRGRSHGKDADGSRRPLLEDTEVGAESTVNGDGRSESRRAEYAGAPVGESGPRIQPSSQLDGGGRVWVED